jgi:hypothetical protein
MNVLIPWAEDLSRQLLQERLPRRWVHVQGVAARARSLAPVLGTEAGLLEAAAWLHDIGYVPDLAVTDLHAFDAPATCATPTRPTPCYAGWSPITPTPSSKRKNGDLPTY